MRDIIEIKKINEHFYIFNENLNENMYYSMALVVGNKKAAIIDTGHGASGDLDKVIRKITDKPVVCLLTHCDPDHAGAAALFDEVYMNDDEAVLMDKGSINYQSRMMLMKNMCKDKEVLNYVKEHLVKANSFQYKSLKDGDKINLGDVVLEAISLPGHTKGSMCFYNEKEKYVVTGDSVANVNCPVIFFDKSEPLHVYKAALKRFVDKIGTDTVIYTGHDIEPLSPQVIPEIFELCDEIFAGKTEKDTPYMPPFFQVDTSNMSLQEKIIINAAMDIVKKEELGNAKPLLHKKEGFLANVKYNANKL